MPILYESLSETELEPGKRYTVGFQLSNNSVSPQTMKQAVYSRVTSYNWISRGVSLENVEVEATSDGVQGTLTLKMLQTFQLPLLLLVLVPSVLGFVGTIAKVWLVGQVANPLLAKGPLGLPVVAWILITATGVLVPLAIILTRKR